MLATFCFFALIIGAGLAWECWSFYYAPLDNEDRLDERKKNDAAREHRAGTKPVD